MRSGHATHMARSVRRESFALAWLIDWRQLLTVVRPDTLVRWHRQGHLQMILTEWIPHAPLIVTDQRHEAAPFPTIAPRPGCLTAPVPSRTLIPARAGAPPVRGKGVSPTHLVRTVHLEPSSGLT